jgi:hypothetical protein
MKSPKIATQVVTRMTTYSNVKLELVVSGPSEEVSSSATL